jgi:hypothetical protein
VLSLILSIVLNLVASATHSPRDAQLVRTEVADGSVWADVWETHGGDTALRASVRLAAADARLRYVPVDVDGDGRLDVVAFALDGRGLRVWRASGDGFTRVQ